ncbi:hypothetical protein GTY83_23115 [Streptomyces sp. SID4928]|uniref:hypothetical protein n=1 Tax=unclassified Streptomyces TaxID=2593676 RepID=UPI0001C19C64|nr:hypothetical protein [Streptomyces sp. ACT-1]EGE43952.1 hypothetical protein SACT1_4630 [Streptomyces sp. ACT-1]MYR51986.1 hypothetical protein [Streptomyces sp. SID4928]
MDTQQNTALRRALAEVPGPLPTSGVIHVVIPHTDRFTVVGNHLAQHPGLSCTAVGIAVRIQSLPQGVEVSIKALAARCREGEKRIAAGLRELEDFGYLQRVLERLPSGRVVTRTVFCNQPAALLHPRHPAAPRQRAAPAPLPSPEPAPTPPPAPAPAAEQPMPPEQPVPPDAPAPEAPTPLPVPPPPPLPQAEPVLPLPPSLPFVPPPTAPKPPPRPLPRPSDPTPELDRAATAFLGDLHRHAPRFLLTEDDVRQLAPGVAAWLERAVHPDALRHALTDDPPVPLRRPALLLRHRLTELLPPPPPGARELAALAHRPRTTVTPFQTCDDCDRAFRSPTPGRCRDCRDRRSEPIRSAA